MGLSYMKLAHYRRAFFPVLAFVITLLAAGSCPAAQAPPAASGPGECQSGHSAVLAESVPYCVLLPPSYDAQKDRRYPVLYFLHGLGDNEQTFLRSGAWNMVQDLWQRGELGEFLI